MRRWFHVRVRYRCRSITKGYGVYASRIRDDHGRKSSLSRPQTPPPPPPPPPPHDQEQCRRK
ncbi:hypothetical protein Scep_030259 [Stephania cephalantha]|uniref:Uncharacterized protein n=1 Tax=Stephania cephalantha TaxID=152367 RepID=A0AAP0HD05_9MAGN